MKFSRYLGTFSVVLGALALLFFAILFLIGGISVYYPEITNPLTNVPELSNLTASLFYNNPTLGGTGNSLGVITFFGYSPLLYDLPNFYFGWTLALTIVAFALLLLAFTSGFSPLSSIITFISATLLTALFLVAIIVNSTRDSLPAAFLWATPTMLMMVGGALQFFYFVKRKKFRVLAR